jgi:protein-S-isoprenylcysteine O-methyltransferase Ste14
MTDFLRFFLPIYFIVYFGIAFMLKSLLVALRIGKNPLVLPQDDTAYGLVGRYFKLTLIAMFAYVLLYAFMPTHIPSFVFLNQVFVVYVGLFLLVFALIWTIIAQGHMQNSWRIGIDTETKTDLVTTGLFAISRNPIFLGMLISLWGLFLSTPNVCTLLFFIVGYILIQVQVRLEEEFLRSQHGQAYSAYMSEVGRFF